jgi:fructose-1,6-bisphosphatase/sedoheptulose 1,7-bisphosphatase-like protein
VVAKASLSPDPDRNLALELVRATEVAAMAAARQLGRGDKEAVDQAAVDQAAVDAMRPVLGSAAMYGVVVIGEGEKDIAPMLYNGERVGNGSEPRVDIAVDPQVLTIDDLVRGDNAFFAATGVTDGELLRGVRFERHEVLTHSLSMRSRSGTVHLIDTRHQLGKSNPVARSR